MESCNGENHSKCEKIIYIKKFAFLKKYSKPGKPALTVNMYHIALNENESKFK